jgi:hypothetical protein
MKQIHQFLFFSLFFSGAYAQQPDSNYLPEIKEGTIFHYLFKEKDGGQFFVKGEILSTENGRLSFVDSIHFGGRLQVNKTVISKSGMENGNKMRPPNEEPTSRQHDIFLFVLSDDKTDHCFSRRFFRTIKEQGSANYGGITYKLLPQPADAVFRLDNKQVDVLYIVSANGQKKFWILNNPLYPFIVRSASENINVELTGISN